MIILWAALCLAPLQFLFVLLVARPEDAVPPSPVMPYVFAALAVGMAVFGTVLPARMVDRFIRAKQIETRVEVSSEETLFRHAAPTRRVFVEPFAAVMPRVIQGYQTALIVSLAGSEAIVVFGFLLGFLGFDLTVAAPFFAVGWLLMVVRFPRAAALRARIEKIRGATFITDEASIAR